MSLYCYNTSANRGRCTQICRRRYKVIDIDTGKELEVDNNYVMSSSDLCTIGMLDKLIGSGIKVLKFEGLRRGAEYVDTVIRTYKEALIAIENGSYSLDKIKKWNVELKTVFNRGSTEGFYMGRKTDEWSGVHGSKATKEKLQVGIVEKYYPKMKIAEIKIQANDLINSGEEFLIIGPRTRLLVKGKFENMWLNGVTTEILKQGDIATFKLEQVVKANDKVFVFREKND